MKKFFLGILNKMFQKIFYKNTYKPARIYQKRGINTHTGFYLVGVYYPMYYHMLVFTTQYDSTTDIHMYTIIFVEYSTIVWL